MYGGSILVRLLSMIFDLAPAKEVCLVSDAVEGQQQQQQLEQIVRRKRRSTSREIGSNCTPALCD
jgi:hypothetical protein